MTKTIITAVVAALIVSLGVVLFMGHGGTTFGSQVQNDVFTFVNGINAGISNTPVINSKAQWVGGILSSVAASFTGTFSLVQSTTTSMVIGSSSKTGCIELGSTPTGSVVYITATNSTVSATTTKPATCK